MQTIPSPTRICSSQLVEAEALRPTHDHPGTCYTFR